MNQKERMSHPSDPKLTALALNLRKGSELIFFCDIKKSTKKKTTQIAKSQ